MRDATVRAAERAIDLTDPMSVQRFVIERQRAEDPFTKMRALADRANALYRDTDFGFAALVAAICYARRAAFNNERQGVPRKGFIWVRARMTDPDPNVWPTPDVRDVDPDAFWQTPRVELHAIGDHEPRYDGVAENAGGGSPGCVALHNGGLCGAHATVTLGRGRRQRCVTPVPRTEWDAHLDRERTAVTWWRGSKARNRRALGERYDREGVRHYAVAFWDGLLGIVALEVRTGTDTQRVSSVLPILKNKRTGPMGEGEPNREALRAWALGPPDPSRVLMTTRHWEEGPFFEVGKARGGDR